MKDNSIFLAVIKKFGILDLDVHYIDREHLFSTNIGDLHSEWDGKSTFADLSRVKKKLPWLKKARECANRNKEGLHLILLLNDTHKAHYDYIFTHAKALYFLDKPYILVVFQGDTQGIPLIYRMATEETNIERLHFLNRTLICDF